MYARERPKPIGPDADGHQFDEALICTCGATWGLHQREPTNCEMLGVTRCDRGHRIQRDGANCPVCTRKRRQAEKLLTERERNRNMIVGTGATIDRWDAAEERAREAV